MVDRSLKLRAQHLLGRAGNEIVVLEQASEHSQSGQTTIDRAVLCRLPGYRNLVDQRRAKESNNHTVDACLILMFTRPRWWHPVPRL